MQVTPGILVICSLEAKVSKVLTRDLLSKDLGNVLYSITLSVFQVA